MAVGYTAAEMLELTKRIGKCRSTLEKWVKEGCDLRNHASVQEWIDKKRYREPAIARKYREISARERGEKAIQEVESLGNGEDLAPAGQRGAQHALARLESQEEEGHRRLQAALSSGNAYRIEKAQEYWLKCSETLRRLDLAVEVARRQEETQIPLKSAEAAVLASAEWMRIAFTTFWSSEGVAILGIKTVGELKAYVFERFKGILDLTVRAADKTASPVPDWAKERIKEAWNVK